MSFETGPVIFPEHFGFCEGVASADDLLRRVTEEAQQHGIPNVFGLHDIVHNADVVAAHQQNGVRFVDSTDEIPDNSIVVTSAHGVAPKIKYELDQKGATVFDAACPLVIHTHKGAEQARREKEKVIYICKGKPGQAKNLHEEVEAMLGHLDYKYTDGELIEDPVERSFVELGDQLDWNILSGSERYRIITQTTLIAEKCFDYRQQIKNYILGLQPDASVEWSKPGEVCFAVSDRQKGVEQLVELRPRRIVVATDPGSKNGRGYFELASELAGKLRLNTTVHAVATPEEAATLGQESGMTALTASASMPDATTFAIAQALGMEELPSVERKMFKLADARPGIIPTEIAKHVLRLSQST